MKRIVLATLITSSATFLHAQIDKNKFLISATTGYDAFSYKNFNWNTSAGIGYAVGKNSVLSANFGYSLYREKWNHNNSFTDEANTFSAGATWRKYMPIKGKFGWFMEVNGGAEWSEFVARYDSTTLPRSGSSKYYSIGVKPGLYYAFSKRVMLTADVGGINAGILSSRFSNQTQRTSDFHYNFNFLSSFKIGLNIQLGK